MTKPCQITQEPSPGSRPRRLFALVSSLLVLGLTVGLGQATAAAKTSHKKKEKTSAAKKERAKASLSARAAKASAPSPTPAPTTALAAPPAASSPPLATGTTTALVASTPATTSATAPVLKPIPRDGAGPRRGAPRPGLGAGHRGRDTHASRGARAVAVADPPGSVFYVEHLGAEAYPGDHRGLYGGSLWLEPSFHGLQWPYIPHTALGLSGYAWVDTGYEQIIRGQSPMVSADTKEWVQQARAVLRATPTYSDGKFFIQGQVELVGNSDQIHAQNDANAGIVDIDDLWIRVGSWNAWDLKVGRYEAWEMYHTGMGLDINTIERRGATQNGFGSVSFERPDYYGVTYLHDRPSLQDVGDVALHLYPSPFLRFELLGQLGADAVATNSGSNQLGARPAAILDLGFLKVKAGAEYARQTHSDSYIKSEIDANGNSVQVKADSAFEIVEKGVGGSVQVVFDPYIEGGVSAGMGWVSSHPNDTGTPSATGTYRTGSIGGFANASGRLVSPALSDLLVGAGVNWTTRTDENRDVNGKIDYTANLQAFGAVQYLVRRQLFVKGVVAYARSDFDLADIGGGAGGVWSNDMWSFRLRMMYLF